MALGYCVPLIDRTQQAVNSENTAFPHVNNITTPELSQEFQPYLDSMDINQELNSQQIIDMRQIIMDNLKAFAFGSKKLGQTNLVTMSLDTRDSKPISTAPYHASPVGRKMADDTLAELIADDVIEDSDSPWASPVCCEVTTRSTKGGYLMYLGNSNGGLLVLILSCCEDESMLLA